MAVLIRDSVCLAMDDYTMLDRMLVEQNIGCFVMKAFQKDPPRLRGITIST